MFTLQARSMGYHVVVLDPDPLSPAGAVADRHLRASYDNESALAELATSCAAVTTEFENVPAATLRRLAQSALVRPPVEAVAITQDRVAEKSFLQQHGFATAPFRPVENRDQLLAALGSIPRPALLRPAGSDTTAKDKRSLS